MIFVGDWAMIATEYPDRILYTSASAPQAMYTSVHQSTKINLNNRIKYRYTYSDEASRLIYLKHYIIKRIY